MTEEQKLEIIAIDTLLARTREFHAAGYRLVQIGATRAEGIELNYSFDKDYHFVNQRVAAPADVPVPSIRGIYCNVVLYENEIHD
ncbi:MAG: NADH-quinone oxidoreductase subunit C, partial [Candidatus Omnitrophica bacterium]|nr:NADH-quinone oxidoreductase subunit C [Candidatus Omnitrophota bacterium]